MSEATTFTTPVGRLVGGSLWQGEDKDDKGQPYIYAKGRSIGQAYSKYSFGIAIDKNNPEYPTLYALGQACAQAGFPQGQHLQPTFAWKITDGDSNIPNGAGNIPCEREGYPGHWVIWFSGTSLPRCYDQSNKPLTDPESIKKGYFIRIAGSVKDNNNPGTPNNLKPGLYWNYALVQLCGYGTEIVSGVDAGTVFKVPVSAAGYVPAGMSQTPSAPVAPAPVAPPSAPAPDFPEGPEMAKDGNTVQSYIDIGWTREMLVANGQIPF